MRAILTYHSVDPSGSPISVDEATLARHVAFLSSGRVPVVPLERIADVPEREDALAITFDDGFANFETLAWPLLERAHLPVTLFVATRRVGADNAWGGREAKGIPRLELLGWEALRRLASRGLSLGSHSRSHPRLTRVDDGQLAGELEGSAEDLRGETGFRPNAFCYPYGDFDPRVVEAARRVYACACTTELRALSGAEDRLRLPRLDAYYYRSPGRLESWGSLAFRTHLLARGTARRLRRALAGDGTAPDER